ncbi:hypothetical protein [Streptomyces sp. NPDC051569]|uniref:hypothetical protein n=1 Tax=Streptomyces sp. NPDC051569 TaxID=3365661 RepID=UPI0037915ED0
MTAEPELPPDTGNTSPRLAEPSALDLAAMDETVRWAVAIRFAMPERSEIDEATRTLVGHTEELLGRDLGYDEDHLVREVYREAYGLLDLGRRPTGTATQFSAYEYLRELARVTLRLASAYRETHEGGGER